LSCWRQPQRLKSTARMRPAGSCRRAHLLLAGTARLG